MGGAAKLPQPGVPAKGVVVEAARDGEERERGFERRRAAASVVEVEDAAQTRALEEQVAEMKIAVQPVAAAAYAASIRELTSALTPPRGPRPIASRSAPWICRTAATPALSNA